MLGSCMVMLLGCDDDDDDGDGTASNVNTLNPLHEGLQISDSHNCGR